MNGTKDIVLAYVVSFVLILVALFVVRWGINTYLTALILAVLVIFGLVYFTKEKREIKIKKGSLMRYSLLCHSCNWEWMSNVTGDKKYAKKCPNCSDSSKIEIIGVRKISKLLKKSNKDLTSYFKK